MRYLLYGNSCVCVCIQTPAVFPRFHFLSYFCSRFSDQQQQQQHPTLLYDKLQRKESGDQCDEAKTSAGRVDCNYNLLDISNMLKMFSFLSNFWQMCSKKSAGTVFGHAILKLAFPIKHFEHIRTFDKFFPLPNIYILPNNRKFYLINQNIKQTTETTIPSMPVQYERRNHH